MSEFREIKTAVKFEKISKINLLLCSVLRIIQYYIEANIKVITKFKDYLIVMLAIQIILK